ncbi:MAG: glycosyltransferase [Corynebacteriales bacterium]|nr:glycosyltransferase [Mycobacteriales bacterium]
MNAPVSGDVTLSVIVAAKDAETLIEDCLTSVLPQLRPGDDIVVIDDRSCDATAEICARLGVRLLLNSHAPGPYGARNLGAALATTTALVFFDTRCRALDGWLESHRDALRDADRPVISYSDIEVEQTPDIAAAIARHLNPFSVGTYARVGFYPACNLGVGRELFWQAGGFEEIRGGADAGLCFRATAMGAHFVVDRQTRVRWRPRATFRALQGQYRRYGTSKYRLRTDRVPLLVLDTAVFLPLRALGTFIGKPSSRASLRARIGAGIVQANFESAILRAALSDCASALRRRWPRDTRWSTHSGSGGI